LVPLMCALGIINIASTHTPYRITLHDGPAESRTALPLTTDCNMVYIPDYRYVDDSWCTSPLKYSIDQRLAALSI
jgi:hypothetical protein